jgi:hypothetical protein
MDAHVASLNHIQASTLIFDTRFTEQLDAVRGDLTSVRHLVAVGPDTPDWATAFTDLEDGGDPDDPTWTWTRTLPVSCSSPPAPPANQRPG